MPFSVTMKLNLTYEYMLPKAADDEGNPISYKIISTPSIDPFLTIEPDRFYFKPTLWTELGSYKLSLILTDL